MRKIGLVLLVAGAAGFFLLPAGAWRWESAGVAVTGFVMLVIPARDR
ncbi:MAG TPA: hypothetical protein VKH46_04100 [Thermoanaerobaculia bacterium]|jgi:hypothetical protein|nr:hypothetical protein [Thermoanaerobaculia bacterium]